MNILNKVLENFSEEILRFNKEIFKLGKGQKLAYQAMMSFRNGILTYPKDKDTQELLQAQYILNELTQYDYIEYDQYEELQEELSKLDKLF